MIILCAPQQPSVKIPIPLIFPIEICATAFPLSFFFSVAQLADEGKKVLLLLREGGEGTVTPLLHGKVQIPSPTGHFIDPPLSQDIFY